MPRRFLHNPAEAAELVARFAHAPEKPYGTSSATVRDYCDSLDYLPQITPVDGDLKNVQRSWAVKAVIAHVPPPAKVLEIGGGEPIVSGLLSELGYEATLVDPYDGCGNGPTEYERYLEEYPHVTLVREYFRPGLPGLVDHSFNAIFSISVLEHLPADALTTCFDAVAEFLRPGGASIHCFDFILQGPGDLYDFDHAQHILKEQSRVTGEPHPPFDQLLEQLRSDVETFFLSPQGHHQWRGGRPYQEFPFRRVISLQTVGRAMG